MMPTLHHLNHVYANNRAEVFHQPTRQPEPPMGGFKPPAPAQRFLTLHGLTHNFFPLGRHLVQMAIIQLDRVYQETEFEIVAVSTNLVLNLVFPGSKIPGV